MISIRWIYFIGLLQGGTIKLSPKKRRHDSISVKWKPVFFFCCWPSTSWPFVYKSQEREETSIMSESDTMFNERDRRCAAVQLCSLPIQVMTTGPLPAPSKCKSGLPQIMPRVMKTKFLAMVMVFGVVSSEGHIMPSHIFEVSLKVNTKVYLDVLKSVVIPWCNKVASGRPWVLHKSKETQAWLPKECYDFVPFSHWPSSSPDLNLLEYFVWSYVENITNITSHNTKASLIAEYSPSSRQRLWKRHAPSSRSVSRQWLRLKAATLNRCQLYYISYLNWFFQ